MARYSQEGSSGRRLETLQELDSHPRSKCCPRGCSDGCCYRVRQCPVSIMRMKKSVMQTADEAYWLVERATQRWPGQPPVRERRSTMSTSSLAFERYL